MTGLTALLLLATVLAALTTLAALAKICTLQRHLELKKCELESYKDAHAELCRVSWSFRNVFDHFGTYVDADEKLQEFVWRLGVTFPRYVEALPRMLRPMGPEVPRLARETAVPDFPVEFRDGGELDGMVHAINDPVFNRLWKIRTPAAISEMLRHGVFLSFGYPHAVATWEPDGVNLDIKPVEVGYVNWGRRPLAALDSLDRIWRDWRVKQRPSAT